MQKLKVIPDLNQKQLKKELVALNIRRQEIEKAIKATRENKYLWFRIGDIVCTYTAMKHKKWCLMYK